MNSGNEEWVEIHGFRSAIEYQMFHEWLSEMLEQANLVEVPVRELAPDGSIFGERWFRARSGDVWRLVPPDNAFRGFFAKLSEDSTS